MILKMRMHLKDRSNRLWWRCFYISRSALIDIVKFQEIWMIHSSRNTFKKFLFSNKIRQHFNNLCFWLRLKLPPCKPYHLFYGSFSLINFEIQGSSVSIYLVYFVEKKELNCKGLFSECPSGSFSDTKNLILLWKNWHK